MSDTADTEAGEDVMPVCVYCDDRGCWWCDPEESSNDAFVYPEPTTWTNPVFSIKEDNGVVCTEQRCYCHLPRLGQETNEALSEGPGEAFRWSPGMPPLRFGP